MKIIVVGCGKIGSSLAEGLVNEGHDVTIVDQSEKVLKSLASKLDIMGVQGNGAVKDVLLEAGVDTADLLIAATESDEVNILCCLTANNLGRVSTIARIRNPEYEDQTDYFLEELKISLIINPDKLAAKSLIRLLKFPSAAEIETFSGGRVELIKMRVAKDSPLCDTAMKDFPKKFSGAGALVCTIERDSQVLIPGGSTRILANDLISFVARPQDAAAFCRQCNLKNQPDRSAFVIGGGRITYYFCELLKNDRRAPDIKVIESDEKRAEFVAEAFGDVTVIGGDGTNQQLLVEEGIAAADAVITLTGNDELNMVAGLMAGQLTKARTIVKVNRLSSSSVLRNLPVDSVMSPREVVSDEVLRYVRGMDSTKDMDIESLYTLAGGKAEALEFTVPGDKRLVGITLMDLKLKPNVLVASIIRGRHVLRPGGSDMLEAGDHVIIITTNKGFRSLADILA